MLTLAAVLSFATIGVPAIPVARPEAAPALRLIGAASIAADATDLSGLTDTLPDAVPHNRLASMGSGLARVDDTNRYLMVADRGPRDGAVPFHCRFHEFELTLDASAEAREPLRLRLISTTLLSDQDGAPLIGSASAINTPTTPNPAHPPGRRFDPESIRVLPDGQGILIADEYGPSLSLFDRASGKRIGTLPVPESWTVATPRADAKEELAANTPLAAPRGASNPRGGRVPNNGFESLDLSPDGTHAYALLQGPLIQDGGKAGRVCRLLCVPLAGTARHEQAGRQFAYVLDAPGLGTNELLTLDEHRFLVIERDGQGGDLARVKHICLIDTRGADEVSGLAAMPASGLPRGTNPVRKRLLIDLLDGRYGLAGPTFPAKVEGLAWGPALANGSRVLLVSTDNDFRDDQPTWVWAFEVPAAELAE